MGGLLVCWIAFAWDKPAMWGRMADGKAKCNPTDRRAAALRFLRYLLWFVFEQKETKVTKAIGSAGQEGVGSRLRERSGHYGPSPFAIDSRPPRVIAAHEAPAPRALSRL